MFPYFETQGAHTQPHSCDPPPVSWAGRGAEQPVSSQWSPENMDQMKLTHLSQSRIGIVTRLMSRAQPLVLVLAGWSYICLNQSIIISNGVNKFAMDFAFGLYIYEACSCHLLCCTLFCILLLSFPGDITGYRELLSTCHLQPVMSTDFLSSELDTLSDVIGLTPSDPLDTFAGKYLPVLFVCWFMWLIWIHQIIRLLLLANRYLIQFLDWWTISSLVAQRPQSVSKSVNPSSFLLPLLQPQPAVVGRRGRSSVTLTPGHPSSVGYPGADGVGVVDGIDWR